MIGEGKIKIKEKKLITTHPFLYTLFHPQKYEIACEQSTLSDLVLNQTQNHCKITIVYWFIIILGEIRVMERQTDTEIDR